mmetsp:Transcript_45821/g.114620  ORF Transcript_45821/g.114620 Transcript_45821/m.114620 type:complete len:301 (+) Transcript_45821:413-1315(+)
MAHQPVEVLHFDACLLAGRQHRLGHRARRELEHVLPLHGNVVESAQCGGVLGVDLQPVLRHVAVERAVAFAVGVHVAAQHRALLAVQRGLHHHRAGAVPKQDACAPIPPVHVAGEGVGADDEHVLRGAGLDELAGGDCGDHKPRARGGDVEGNARVVAQLGLHLARAAEHVVRTGGGEQDQVQLLRLHACHLQRRAAGLRGQVRQLLTLAEHAPCTDSSSGADPLVVSVDQLREVVVADDRVGHRAADAREAHARAGRYAPTPALVPRRRRRTPPTGQQRSTTARHGDCRSHHTALILCE